MQQDACWSEKVVRRVCVGAGAWNFLVCEQCAQTRWRLPQLFIRPGVSPQSPKRRYLAVTRTFQALYFRPICCRLFHSDQTKKRRKRRKGGVRQRLNKMAKQGCNRMSLQTVVLSSIRSLRSKTDELQATVNYIHECKNVCLLAFTETWLDGNVQDNELFIDGLGTPICLDRNSSATRKSHGGGVCLHVNRKWCNIIAVRDMLYTLDIELLTVSLHPFYSPRDSCNCFFTVVYIHPRANHASRAAEILSSSIHRLESLFPDAPKFRLGDFNQFKMGKTLKNCHQYVTCAIRHNRTVDVFRHSARCVQVDCVTSPWYC